MPEKPEVITVAKSLTKRLIGKHFTSCKVYWENIIQNGSIATFEKGVCHQKIQKITTRGKWIVIQMEKSSLLIHLRMEGKFFFKEASLPKEKHEHVIFTLDDGTTFRFHDVRKFGKMSLLPNDIVFQSLPLSALGYEFNDDKLTKEYLKEHLKNRHIPIKTALLDQSIIAGIGNIYDDEILFYSHISPFRKANKVSLKECETLIKNTKEVLEKAIQKGGTTIKSFTSEEGVHGRFQNELQVHGKKGEICPICGTVISKVMIQGRGTYFCRHCQK